MKNDSEGVLCSVFLCVLVVLSASGRCLGVFSINEKGALHRIRNQVPPLLSSSSSFYSKPVSKCEMWDISHLLYCYSFVSTNTLS